MELFSGKLLSLPDSSSNNGNFELSPFPVMSTCLLVFKVGSLGSGGQNSGGNSTLGASPSCGGFNHGGKSMIGGTSESFSGFHQSGGEIIGGTVFSLSDSPSHHGGFVIIGGFSVSFSTSHHGGIDTVGRFSLSLPFGVVVVLGVGGVG